MKRYKGKVFFMSISIALLMFNFVLLAQINSRDKFEYRGNLKINERTKVVAAMYNINSEIYNGLPEVIARQFLQENRKEFGISDTADLKVVSTIQSPAGKHVGFIQTFHGIPIYGAETVVSINKENRVSMVVNGSVPVLGVINVATISEKQAMKIALSQLLVEEKNLIMQPKTDQFIYEDSVHQFHLTWKIKFVAKKPQGNWQVFIDAGNGEMLNISNIAFRYVNGQGRVFKPDPITALRDTSLKDQNNSDYAVLQAAYTTVTLSNLSDPVYGLYSLQGKYAKSIDIDSPETTPVTNITPSFLYNRSQSGFEETNAYYFIDLQRQYIGSLGFSPQWGGYDYICFDAHGTDSSDSWYVPGSQYIIFGVGGIDCAEDQDVILHEYTHALQEALMPIKGISVADGDEWKISEGSADYMALSYRKTLSNFRSDHFSNWFGNGESFNGRTLNAYYTYSLDWSGNDPHDPAGVLWASTMMDIENSGSIGRDVATTLLLTSFGFVTPSSSVSDQIIAIFRADYDVYGGQHLSVIKNIFEIRGFPLVYIPITINQKLSDGSTVNGTVKRWTNGSFQTLPTIPDTVNGVNGIPEVFQGDQRILASQKYNNWNHLSDVTNHHVFPVTSASIALTSNFNDTSNALLQIQLDGVFVTGDTIKFKDPWLIDTTDQYGTRNRGMSAPFKFIASGTNLGTNTTYNGVFLGQRIQDSVYYSITAPLTQSIGGFKSYFQGWTKSGTSATFADSTKDTTAVVFNSAGATVIANYKAHLGTNNTPQCLYLNNFINDKIASPTNGDGQQRIVSTWSDWSHTDAEDIMVYCSAGEIWTTSYDWNTGHWSPEVRLSDGSGSNSRPSIAARGVCNELRNGLAVWGDGIYVVWQKQNTNGSYDVYFAFRNSYTNCEWTDYIGWVTKMHGTDTPFIVNAAPCSVEPQPVVGVQCNNANNANPRVECIPVSYYQSANVLKRQYARQTTSSGYFDGSFHCDDVSTLSGPQYGYSTVGQQDVTISQPQSLTGSVDTSVIAYILYDNYGLSRHLFSVDCMSNIDNSGTQNCIMGTAEQIPVNDGRYLCGAYAEGDGDNAHPPFSPQVIRRNGKTMYAWAEYQEYDAGFIPFVVYQDRTSSGWNDQYSAWIVDVPSVSLGNYGSYTYLEWASNNTIYEAIDSGGTWNTYTIGNGQDPQMTYICGDHYPSWYLCGQTGSSLWSVGVSGDVESSQNQGQSISSSAKQVGMLSAKSGSSKSTSSAAGLIDKRIKSVPIGTPVATTYSRILHITDTSTKAQVSITVTQPKLGNRMLAFNPVNDTITVENCLQMLCPQATTVGEGDDTLSCKMSVRSRNLKASLNPIMFSLSANGKSSNLMSAVPDSKKGYSKDSVKLSMKNYKGSSLNATLAGLDVKSLGKNLKFSLGHVYEIDTTSAVKTKSTTAQTMPTSTVTFGSYPNPFNPTTTVSYQLTENSHVRLMVYDMLGRQVATLADGNKEAGQYTAVFDGSHFASGVYFVRLIVQGSNSQQIVKTLKVQMLK